MDEKTFRKLNKEAKIYQLKNFGKYLGSRETEAYFIHLYYLKPLYIEIHIIRGLNVIHWIEVQKNKDIIHSYVEKINIKDLFKE